MAFCFVLAALNGSTYQKMYASPVSLAAALQKVHFDQPGHVDH